VDRGVTADDRLTILLAEDDEQIRRLFSEVLRRNGYHVIVAESGDDAMIKFAEHDGSVHLLLTDLMMPMLRGDKLAQHIRTLHPEVKIIYISGYGVTTRLQGGVLDEDAVLVQKPVTPDKLLAIVKDTLAS
jgi:two-component system cell cycle sensor histidine kinase/response regulator CckA